MIEDRGARSSEDGPSDGVLWEILRDLAELTRAHARLTEDLIRLLERQAARSGHAPAPAPAGDALFAVREEAPTPPATAELESAPGTGRAEEVGSEPAPESEPQSEPEPESEPEAQPEPEPAPEPQSETEPEPDRAAEAEECAHAPEGALESGREHEPSPVPEPADSEAAPAESAAATAPDPIAEPEPERAVEEPDDAAAEIVRAAESETSAGMPEVEVAEASEGGQEGLEEGDGSGPIDATVLTLESGDTRVGVYWDQVIRVGTLDQPTPPEEIEMEGASVPLVSLGRLLHGVSREEKCFVVIENEGERASIACERALGIGPLGSLAKHDSAARIQVLRVPMLRAFAHAPSNGRDRPQEAPPPPTPAEIEAEERDRHGPLRALVAVRYLPARVAICRHLRGKGWQVGEAAGLEAATVSLDLGRWDLFFLEASGNGEPSETESALLRRVGERGVPVVRVGSRVSGYPGHDAPSLMFPFSEAELESIIAKLSRRDITA